MNVKLVLASCAMASLVSFGMPASAQDSGAAGSHGPSAADQKFVTQAAHGNAAEIDEARAQLQGSHNPAVRMYANTMIKDHTLALSQLAALAQGMNLTMPMSHVAQSESSDTNATPPPAASQPPMHAMSDRAYMNKEVTDHQTTIALYQGEASNGASDQLRTYAAETLPTLKSHLAMAQQYVASGTITPQATPTPPGQ